MLMLPCLTLTHASPSVCVPMHLQEQKLQREKSMGGFFLDGDEEGYEEEASPVMGAIADMQPANALNVISYMSVKVGGHRGH